VFVVEQQGVIRVVDNDALRPTPFLDIRSLVQSGGERGLLSMAFHPNYASNGLFYVDYTDTNGDTRVVRYRVSADPNVADAGSAQLVLMVDQPFANHNGGLVAFGPDGMLYVGMGDGGSGGDPLGHGQNTNTLLGALLRLDVDAADPYAVPADNPFGNEIWAYGLRNPWRFAFDRVADMLYIADVGQSRFEEVNAVPATRAGVNYGWNIMEGGACFEPPSGCRTEGLELPVLVYDHGEGCSIIGGFVYRGGRIAAARGHYFYSDFCTGFLRSFRLEAGAAVDHTEWDVGDLGAVLSFGEDAQGELYVLTGAGQVLRVVSREP
jgi:hypothetical protein